MSTSRIALTANTAFQSPLLPFFVPTYVHFALVDAGWETEGLLSATDGLAALHWISLPTSVLFHAKASSKAVA